MGIAAGTTLGGRYVLRSMIAVGGMGEVWRGEDIELARPVAIKTLKESSASNTVFLKRFRNEARNAAGLMHPNIAQVFDYGDQEGTAFLVMELVDGEPLSSILERERTLAERRLVRMMTDTCRGLQAAHAAGIMHRDVKPGNLLVQPGDGIKITDFGVSRATDQTTLTATGMVMGTAQYLAPELALGKPATPASDVYALGIIMYEAVVGKRPFTAATAVDIAVAQVNNDVPPLPDTVSRPLRDLILHVLEKSPRKRPGDAEQLERLLMELRLPAEHVPAEDVPSLEPDQNQATPDAAAAAASGMPGERAEVDTAPAEARRRRLPPSIAPKEHRPRPDVRAR